MAQTLSNFLKKILNELPWKEVVPTQQSGDDSFLSVLSGGVGSRFKVDGVAGSGQSSVLGAALDAAADGGTRQGYGSGGNQDKGGSGYGTGGNTDKGGVGIGYGAGGNTDKGDGGTGHGTGGNPDKGDGGTGHGAGGNPAKGDGGTGHGAGGNPDKGGAGTGHGAGGNPDKGGSGNGKPDDAGNPGNGNPDGTGTGSGKPDDAGNPGKGKGDGSGDGDGISDKPDPAPTPPDTPLLFDTIEAGEGQTQYSASYVFKLDDVTVGWDGQTLGTHEEMLSDTKTMVTKEGLTLHAIDSEFGFYVTDFIGAQGKMFDGDFGEGWVGELGDGNGDGVSDGIAVANASTAKFTVPAKLGTWLAGLGGNSVKASTEHYSVMQAVLSNQAYPGDPTALYNLDDNLWIVDYKVLDDGTGMPELDASGQLQEDDFHHFYIAELAAAMAEAEGVGEADAPIVMTRDFNGDGVVDASEYYQAYMTDREFDGVMREVAVLDFVNNDPTDGDTVDFVDGALNGFGTYGIQDFIAPNESSVIEDIAVGNDYSVTVKDDGKLLYRWGNMVKRPNDVRIDTKIELPDEWTAETYDNGLTKLFRITDAELIINHTVTNNPNDQVRPEDYENEAAIGILPSYVEVRDPFNEGNVLWVAPKDMYAGDGTLLPAYLTETNNGIAVVDLAGETVGYYNEGGTVLRDFSLASTIAGADTALDDIGAMSSDLIGGFTEAYYTTMDREPFMADYVYDEEGNPIDYDTGPRWRLQPEKYGQDLPGVVIPQDPTDPLPIQHGEERYEVGADTTTVLNLLDWNGTSPMALSAGWVLDTDVVSGNGVNMTDMLDTAFYIKGDKKPVNLYDAELRLIYEEVDYATEGTIFADTLLGANGETSHNEFHLSGINDNFDGTDGWADLVVLGYGATNVADFGTNDVYDFGIEEGDALGLIGFDLDPDNYNIHITQAKTDEGNLDLFLDTGDSMGQIATLYGVNEYLEADSFYFA